MKLAIERGRVLGESSGLPGSSLGGFVRVRFGECTLDVDSRELFRGARPVRLSPKAFELLTALVECRPRALTKAQIHDRLWPKTFVSEGSLASLIAEIRSALADQARRPRYIRTVHRFGYAFCAEAEEQSVPKRATGAVCRLIWGNREIALDEGENVLGRTPDSVAWIDSPSVSRRHARITVERGMATLEDLGSKNGTQLGGRKLTAPRGLADGDQIRIGSVLMTFRVFPAAGSTKSETLR